MGVQHPRSIESRSCLRPHGGVCHGFVKITRRLMGTFVCGKLSLSFKGLIQESHPYETKKALPDASVWEYL